MSRHIRTQKQKQNRSKTDRRYLGSLKRGGISRIDHSTPLLLCKGIITITREHGIGENGIGEKLCIALHALRNIAYIII